MIEQISERMGNEDAIKYCIVLKDNSLFNTRDEKSYLV